MNVTAKKPLPEWLPLVVGGAFVVLFGLLCAWQVNRGLEKKATRAAFEAESPYTTFSDGMDIEEYQRLRVDGRFISGRQLLLENVVLDGRQGYYVLTPLETGPDEPWLIVNRGWIAKPSATGHPAAPQPAAGRVELAGRAGRLPRAGFRMGEAIPVATGWPLIVNYPTLDEVAVALGREVQPFALLVDADDPAGLEIRWLPSGFGPARHYAYALQWFTMAVVLLALLIRNQRKRRFA